MTSGRLRESVRHQSFPARHDRLAWIALGRPPLPLEPSDEHFGPGGLSDGPVNLSRLPADPAALARLMSSRKIEGGPPGPGEDFVQVGDLLRETDAPPALRAAVFRVTAGIPGVKVIGTVRNHAGQEGIGVVYTDRVAAGPAAGQLDQQELIFDRATSVLIGESTTIIDPKTGRHGRIKVCTKCIKSGRVLKAA